MTRAPELVTPRLVLRGWRDADLAPFAAMNADPMVMRHLGGPASREASGAMIRRFRVKWAEEPRFGWWMVELRGTGAFIGFVGLSRPDFDEPPAPCVEIGWRLASAFWGHGYATEAARACLAHGFETVGLDEILSFTTPANLPSQRVMARLGMRRDPTADFDHPLVPKGNPNRRHRLYRMDRARWEAVAPKRPRRA